MAEEFEQNDKTPKVQSTDGEENGTSDNLEAARAAGNVWKFNEREMEMFVARGYIETATDILSRGKREPTGAVMIHKFQWNKNSPFIKREGAFATSLRRVGRSTRQNVKVTQLIPVNAELYSQIIQGGVIRKTENGEAKDIPKTREEMLEFARFYPEGASEAIETWLDSARIELLDEKDSDNFDWMFSSEPVVRVLWKLGDPENPAAAAILTFKSPPAEAREKFDDEVQRIDTEKKGDVNLAELSENFAKKIQYGTKYLTGVEGIAVETEGNAYTDATKDKFITLFNPIWFADCVEVMHESFDFTKGSSGKN